MSEPEFRYHIPWAPVSVNDVYGVGQTHNYGYKYLKPEYLAFKDCAKKIFEEQDKERGKPNFKFYEVSYTYYFPPEYFYADAVTGKERSLHEEIVQRKDVSNYAKLIEDALFEYFGLDDARSLVVNQEKAVKTDIETKRYYGSLLDNSFDVGCIEIVVKEKVHDILPFGEKGKLPYWWSESLMPSKPKINLNRELEELSSIESILDKLDYPIKMAHSRISWLTKKIGINPSKILEVISKPNGLAKFYIKNYTKKLADKPLTVSNSPEWLLHSLVTECDEKAIDLYYTYKKLIQEHCKGKGKDSLVCSYDCGFHEMILADLGYTISKVSSQSVLELTSERMKECGYEDQISSLNTMEFEISPKEDTDEYPEFIKDRYPKFDRRFDLIIAPNFIDRFKYPFETVVYLNSLLKPNGILITSYTFNTAKGKTPWKQSKLGKKTKAIRGIITNFFRNKLKFSIMNGTAREPILVFKKSPQHIEVPPPDRK